MKGINHLPDASTLNTEEDARLFYQCIEAEQWDCKEELMTAIVWLQIAHAEVQNAKDQLF